MQALKFNLLFTSKAEQQLDSLPRKDRALYEKAFQLLSTYGPGYRSLRTHRYLKKDNEIWGSSASMSKRFFWDYLEEGIIQVKSLGSH